MRLYVLSLIYLKADLVGMGGECAWKCGSLTGEELFSQLIKVMDNIAVTALK